MKLSRVLQFIHQGSLRVHFSQHGEDAIKNAVARLLSEDPAIFAPKQPGTKYPTLEHLQGRKPDAYMLTELLGKVETKPATK